MDVVKGRLLVAGKGAVRGPLLLLQHPISFWGGVDPVSGTISDPRHPNHGASIRGVVLAIPSAVGSSSSSAIMLELIREGTAPAAIVLGKADAILPLGVVVAAELGYAPIPILELPSDQLKGLASGDPVVVSEAGELSRESP